MQMESAKKLVPARRRTGLLHKQRVQDNITAYVMIAPCIVLLTIFVIIPLLNAVRWSFFDWSFYMDPKFVGTKNYRIVLGDRMFGRSIVVGLRWILLVVPANFIVSFSIALLLKNLKSTFGAIVKTAVYAPHVTSVVVASLIFAYIYDYQFGLLNSFLGMFGVERLAWLADVKLVLPAEAVTGLWLGFGFATLIMLAGVNDIPETYYEAARIDGATAWRRVWHITIPCMRNVFLFVLVTSVTAAMQSFQIQDLMSQGGPLNMSTTPNLLIFNHFRRDPTLGYTMTAALLLFVIIMGLSMFMFKVIRSEKLVD